MIDTLTALAVIPGILIIIYVYRKDKVEKEPVGLIVRLLALGAVSCIVAGFAESFASAFLPSFPTGTLEYALVNSFALAAFWEELLKYLALRIGSWRSPHFNYRFDGVVYGVSSAVGFAIVENIMYVYQYGYQTALVRAFTAVPLHAFCGVAMGVFYAMAKKESIQGRSSGFGYTLLALIVPMMIHGVYDTMAFMRTEASTIGLLVFIVIMYIAAIITIRKLSKADYTAGFYVTADNIRLSR
ncbi:MAG: PrsW family intramembrane metalloprotease [Firmicutes bacterium]|nr:PrsW family intramembrane metalloprotease [Bacillota bacterium]